MPTYEYECASCGPFAVARPMAEFQEPGACPVCGALSPRALFTVPNMSTGARQPSAPAAGSHVHSAGCGCGGGLPATLRGGTPGGF